MLVSIKLLFVLGLWSSANPNPSPLPDHFTTYTTSISDSILKNSAPKPKTDLKVSLGTYDFEKTVSKELRKKMMQDLNSNKITLKDVQYNFTNHLTNGLIPHWYGTGWSFGGHTSIPNEGKIACGYFVSTTLKDMGLNLNRYKLAQKSPLDEALMISCGAPIKTIRSEDTATAIQEIDQHTQEGLYFIGFDEGHVGFLLKKEGELYLIHSNYLQPAAVCLEAIETSNVFKKFSVFHLVDISHNNFLTQKWLEGSEIL